MSDYDGTNQGVLFQNDKDGNEKRPDYKGKLNVDGKDYELAGWKRVSKKGQPFLSLKIEEQRKPTDSNSGWEKARATFKPDEVAEVTEEPISLDEIPF